MAHATMTQIKAGIKARLETIPAFGGRVYDYIPGTQEVPSCTIIPGTFIPGDTKAALTYDRHMAGGSHDYVFTLQLVVARVIEAEAAKQLDAFLSVDDPSSIKMAIEADDDLGGLVSYTKVDRVVQYGHLTWNGIDFFGAQIIAEVTG